MNTPLPSSSAQNSAPAASHDDLSLRLDNLVCHTCYDQDASTVLDSEKPALLLIKSMLSKQQENLDSLFSKFNQTGRDSVPSMAVTPQMRNRVETPAKPSPRQARPGTPHQSELGDSSSRKTWKNSKQFPEKVYEMLEIASNQGFGICSNAVSWLHNGRGFKIHNEQVFMDSIVPRFFRQTKIRSFYRQLNMWGFSRLLAGPDAGSWQNDHFERGQKQKMKKMIRVKIKGTGKMRSSKTTPTPSTNKLQDSAELSVSSNEQASADLHSLCSESIEAVKNEEDDILNLMNISEDSFEPLPVDVQVPCDDFVQYINDHVNLL